MKIAILESRYVNPGDLSWEPIQQFGDVRIFQRTKPEEAAAQIGDAEIILINKTPITAELLDACPNVKLVCVQATGYNVVDCEAARARGVVVCNVPDYSTVSVAQFTFSLLLEICNQAGLHSKLVHEGDWSKRPDFSYWVTPQLELAGKTLGILGYGRIGQAVGRIAKAFGMRVLAYSRSGIPGNGDYVTLDTLLSQSDILSLHCPLSAENAGFINKETIAKMKDGAILLNTARGGLINEQDVCDALTTGKLRAAAMDVVTEEPIVSHNPLLSAPNCIITPHIAWAPAESRQRVIDCVVRNIRAFLAGTPVNVVNP